MVVGRDDDAVRTIVRFHKVVQFIMLRFCQVQAGIDVEVQNDAVQHGARA